VYAGRERVPMADLDLLRLLVKVSEIEDRFDAVIGRLDSLDHRLSRLEAIADDAETQRIREAIAAPLSRIGHHHSRGPSKRADAEL
jgi:hypothetical protein